MLKYFSQVLLSISNTNPDIFRGERTNNLGGKLITVFLFDVSKTFSNIKNYMDTTKLHRYQNSSSFTTNFKNFKNIIFGFQHHFSRERITSKSVDISISIICKSSVHWIAMCVPVVPDDLN